MIKRGEIYLANLNPKRGNEVGKLRPALILQIDSLREVDEELIQIEQRVKIVLDFS